MKKSKASNASKKNGNKIKTANKPVAKTIKNIKGENKKVISRSQENQKGGYNKFLDEFLEKEQKQKGNDFKRKDALKEAQNAWKKLSDSDKLKKYGEKPSSKSVGDNSKGNFSVFKKQFIEK